MKISQKLFWLTDWEVWEEGVPQLDGSAQNGMHPHG